MPDTGYIKVANDERGKSCFVCHAGVEVRFIQFVSPKRGDVMYLRICSSCLDEMFYDHDALRATDLQPKDVSNAPRT